MADEMTTPVPVKNRWLIVIGALLIQLCLGAIYAWGGFTVALQNKPADVAMALNPQLLGVKDTAAYDAAKAEFKKLSADLTEAQKGTSQDATKKAKDAVAAFKKDRITDAWIEATFDPARFKAQVFGFTAKEAQYPFMVGLASFAIMMILAGRWQDKAGPRIVALTGGVVLGTGYLLGGLVGGTSLAMMIIFLGLISGAGIGLGYVCPIAASVKWFPDKKGFITGLAVAGFGAGAYLFVNVAGPWAGLIATYGVSTTFLLFGGVFFVGVILGALLLSNPPAGYKPAGWNPPQPVAGARKSGLDLTQGQTIRTPQFWMTWMAFVLGAGCGLMVIGSLKNFGEKEGGLSPVVAASALGLLALFNGLGRVVWGTMAQKMTARAALVLMSFLQAGMMVLMGLGMMGSSELTLAVAGCWVGFNFGGNFALFPLMTAEFFGTKNLGANYGAVFTSYGVGGILGPMLAGGVWDAMGTYKWAFLIAGGACVIAGIIALLVRAPKSPEGSPAAAA
jgi:OFA family oxalate/formate antiporter-like MFS transporter